ncbi:FimV/HubP family polar landmark protein [Ostreibacterium oceani]|uniref:FimV/HubP family polar landmark protein n=1 Tax=Ostreibacterium oceani TaxID=2654998 RepID=UPI001C40512E|nr:FimV/HubP family polar landmark protein [Ostreibacterium oceani]
MNKKLLSLIAGTVLLIPSVGMAVGLGSIRTYSNLNERLKAEIPILSVRDKGRMTVSLASNAEFASRGIQRAEVLNDLNFSIQEKGGRYYISVSSQKQIATPYINFILRLNTDEGVISREYAIFLDPVTSGAKTNAKGGQSVKKSSSSEGQKKRAETPQRASGQKKTAQAPTKPVSTTLKISNPSGAQYGPVRKGETLWSIASYTRPSDNIPVRDMVAAIKQANPKTLAGAMPAGVRLNIPTIQGYSAFSGGYAPMPGTVSYIKPSATKKAAATNTSTTNTSTTNASQNQSKATQRPAPKPETKTAPKTETKATPQPTNQVTSEKTTESVSAATKAADKIEKATNDATPPKDIPTSSDVGDELTASELAATELTATANEAKAAVVGATDSAIDSVSAAAEGVKETAANAVGAAAETTKDLAQQASDSAKAATSDVVDGAKAATEAVKETAKETANAAAEQATQAAQSAADSVATAANNATEAATEAAKDTAGEVASGVKAAADSAKTSAQESAEVVADTVTETANASVAQAKRATTEAASLMDKVVDKLPLIGAGAGAVLAGVGGLLFLRRRRAQGSDVNTKDIVLLDEDDLDAAFDEGGDKENSVVDALRDNDEGHREAADMLALGEHNQHNDNDGADDELAAWSDTDDETSLDDLLADNSADNSADNQPVSASETTARNNKSADLADFESDIDLSGGLGDFESNDADALDDLDALLADNNETPSDSLNFDDNFDFDEALADLDKAASSETNSDVAITEQHTKANDDNTVDFVFDTDDLDSVDLDLSDTAADTAADTVTDTAKDKAEAAAKTLAATEADDDLSLDFNLEDDGGPSVVSHEMSDDVEEVDLSIDLGKSDQGSSEKANQSMNENVANSQSDYMKSAAQSIEDSGTSRLQMKLDLAKSFISISQGERAKELLEEIINEGSPAQADRARKLLEDIE